MHRLRTLITGLLLLGVVVGGSSAANAQIVNVQPLLDDDTQGFGGTLTGSLSWKTGNVDYLLVEGGLFMRYLDGRHRFIWSNSGAYGQKGGVDFLASVFTHLRYQYRIMDLLTWEAFTQYGYDQFRRFNVRALAGTGPKLHIVDGPAISFAWGVAYMFEFEKLRNPGELDDGEETFNHRLSTYLTGYFKLSPLLGITGTLYYQPSFLAWADDYRISLDVDLSVNLNKTLALIIGFDLSYDSEPPIGVEKLDTALAVSLGITF